MSENDKQAEAWPCKIIESDFEQDTITVQMQNKDYFVSGGTFWLSMHNQAEPVAQNKLDFPLGAILNGRVYADRLQNYYQFDCEAGPLGMCSDWVEFLRCFEYMAQYLEHKSAQPVQPAGAQGEPVDLRELFERLLFGTYAGKDSYYNDEQIKHGCFERAQELVDVAKRMNIALYTEAPAVAVNEQDRLDAARYRWLFGARTEDECQNWKVGHLPLKPQDRVIGQVATVFMPKVAVDAEIDAAIASAEAAKGSV